MSNCCDPMDCRAHQASPSFTVSGVYSNSCLLSQWCHPPISSSPPALNLSPHQGLSWRVGSSHQVAKVVELQLQCRPSSEQSGLISFRMEWFDLLAVQETLKHLLQHHSLKASILRHSSFFIVQLSHPFMTTGKTIALTRRTFVWQSNVSAFQYAV